MSLLQRGSQIFLPQDEGNGTERLALSSGTFCLEQCESSPRYVPSAFVPQPPWRAPSVAELNILVGNGTASRWNTENDVAVVRIPDKVIQPVIEILEEEGIRESCRAEEYVTVARHPNWALNLRMIRDHVSTLSRKGIADSIYFRMADPKLATVTKDEFGVERSRFVGLHLDSWDGLPLRHRHRSRNRLCINLGRGSRFALLINLPLFRMFECIGLRDPEDVQADFRGLYVGQRFMRRFPHYPVVRLRIQPGEAYIMPTDNMIHDASTEGTTSPDLTLTFLGFFSQ
jgi:hypothetical protein